MVKGLHRFRKHFAAFRNSYVLIGGCACDIHFERSGLPFRATKDLDIVLCLEALNRGFVERFWEFIHQGRYRHQQRSTGARQFYRFTQPCGEDFPYMLELFSRRPDLLEPINGEHLTPIPIDEEVSSLSAILLNDAYYELLMQYSEEKDGIRLASPEVLIVFKAKAWMDLRQKKQSGQIVDSGDIKKHKNDIARLVSLVSPVPMTLSSEIASDMADFLRKYEEELPDTRALRLPFTAAQVAETLRQLFY